MENSEDTASRQIAEAEINPAEIRAGMSQLAAEYAQLEAEAVSRLHEIDILDKLLRSLEEQEQSKLRQEQSQNYADELRDLAGPLPQKDRNRNFLKKFKSFLWYRKQFAADLAYVKSAAIGSIAGGGGIPGLVNDPERFLQNLGANVGLSLLVTNVKTLLGWLDYRKKFHIE